MSKAGVESPHKGTGSVPQARQKAEGQVISREEVKVLAQSIGLTAAAQRLGLSEVRVRQWSSREKWFKHEPPALPPTKYPVTVVTKPSDVLATLGKETKHKLAIATHKAAQTFENMEGDGVIKQSRALKDVVGSASQIHGWESKDVQNVFSLNVLSLGGKVEVHAES